MTREKGEDVIRLGDGEEKRGFEAELLSESKSYLFPLIMFVLLSAVWRRPKSPEYKRNLDC